MRAIKFRQPLIDHNGNFSRWHYWGVMGEGHFVSPSNAVDQWDKNYQFTGLLDKNGVEIYEGDILGYDHLCPGDSTNQRRWKRGVVRFGDWSHYGCFDCGGPEGYGFYLDGKHGYDRQTGKKDVYEEEESLAGINEHIEVIGNIYSNPELLENDND